MELTSVDKVVSFYKVKLSTDPNWAVKGLLRIYKNQTVAEQKEKTSAVLNGVGFSGYDARILSSLAQQYIGKKRLSGAQVKLLMEKMPKYARQLFNCGLAEGKVKKIKGIYTF